MRSNRNYIVNNKSRLLRPLVTHALADFDFTNATSAIDFGCGLGVETAHLAASHTWSVLALDQDTELLEMASERLKSFPKSGAKLQRISFQNIYELPAWDFFWAYHSLHFADKENFERLWILIISTAKPNARIAISVFGEKDSMVKHKNAQGTSKEVLIQMLSGFSINYFETTYQAGQEAIHYHEVIATKN